MRFVHIGIDTLLALLCLISFFLHLVCCEELGFSLVIEFLQLLVDAVKLLTEFVAVFLHVSTQVDFSVSSHTRVLAFLLLLLFSVICTVNKVAR